MTSVEQYLQRLNQLRARKSASSRQLQEVFQQLVMSFYQEHGRRDLAWRKTANPYRILVSEIMLQQTQTSRVAEKYPAFLRQFPTVKKLALAEQADVIRAWEGLGYYRRARNLHRAAQAIQECYQGKVPTESSELRSLPGIGSYTAAAVSVFAFNRPEPMIETNIRSVYLYTFFADQIEVSDSEVLSVITATLLRDDPREWFYALMDLGVALKRAQSGINRVSSHYRTQSPFKGSEREVAAKLLKMVLSKRAPLSEEDLYGSLAAPRPQIERALERLLRESLINRTRNGRLRAA
jgi:A/G-specific adenine glycosylase